MMWLCLTAVGIIWALVWIDNKDSQRLHEYNMALLAKTECVHGDPCECDDEEPKIGIARQCIEFAKAYAKQRARGQGRELIRRTESKQVRYAA